MMTLENKTVVIGVCGGIAAYKALEVVSKLKKLGMNVKVMMTKSATEFVTPLSFQSLSQNPVAVNMFEEPKAWEIQHISLAKSADVLAVVPATANIIGKMANGIADDIISTTVLATKAPVIVAPAMNTNMYENPILKGNIEKLKNYGFDFIDADIGRLACGDTGSGKLADPRKIVDTVVWKLLYGKEDLKGKKVLVTAGPTIESLDPVRFISNHSSGKMGYAIAKAAMYRGARVTLISGRVSISPIDGVKTIYIESADDMYKAVFEYAEDSDIIIKAAAVGDYRPKYVSDEKIKKNEDEMMVELVKNRDILKELGTKYGGRKVIVGFCMETQNLIENAKKKLSGKNVDFIVANSLTDEGSGFRSDTNAVTILDRKGGTERIEQGSKFDVANKILTYILGYNYDCKSCTK